MPTGEREFARSRIVLAFLAYLAFIVYQTVVSDAPIACHRLSWDSLAHHPRLSRGDLLANLVAYIPLGALGLFAAAPRPRAWAIVLVWLACTLVSVMLELLQGCFPDRTPALSDMVTNSLGALLGIGISMLVIRWHRRIESPRVDGWTPAWFSKSPLPLIALLMIVLWWLIQTAPWKFNLSVSNARQTFSFLIRQEPTDLNLWRLTLHATAWSAIGMSLLLALKPAAPRLVLLALSMAGSVLVQPLAQGATLSFEETYGMAAGFLLTLALRWRNAEGLVAAIALCSGVAALCAYQLQPVAGAPLGEFRWWPQIGRSHLYGALVYTLTMAFFALPACLVIAWGRKVCGWNAYLAGFIAIALLGVATAAEVAQVFIPGRFGDTSSPLLIAMTWMVVWSLGPYDPFEPADPVAPSRAQGPSTSRSRAL
jgi:VanZ family protein